ncbi:MAG: polyphenol oxidase family protein [Pseudonocardiaceae bacterium]
MAPVTESFASAKVTATALTLTLGPASVVFTGRRQGDLRPPISDVGIFRGNAERAGEVGHRQRAVVDHPWAWMRQVHGCDVVNLDEPSHQIGEVGDAGVATVAGLALAVFTADCVPVVFASPEGVIAVAHAGWSGLLAGVVGQTVTAMRMRGASTIDVAIGPCIRPRCYEFGSGPLALMVDRFGPTVSSLTAAGVEALDLPACAKIALREAGVLQITDVEVCTACSADYYSWRVGRNQERQAAVIWR